MSVTLSKTQEGAVPPPPSSPRSHITHLLEQALHKVAISRLAEMGRAAALREVGFGQAMVPGSPAGRQGGGQAASRWGCRSPAHLPASRVPQSLEGVCPRPGPSSICLQTASPLLLWLRLEALAPGEAQSPELLPEVPQGRRGGHSGGHIPARQGDCACNLQMAGSGCMSGPVSQLPGQGATSGGGCFTSSGRTQ